MDGWRKVKKETIVNCFSKCEKKAETELKNKDKQKNKLSQAALSIVDDLNSFCETLVNTDLASASNLVIRRFETSKNVWQKEVNDYFNKTL